MIRSILLPIDGSNYTESVLNYGIFLARHLEAQLRVISVIDIRLFEWNLAAGADSFIPVMGSGDFQDETHKMLQNKANSVLEKAKDILNKNKIEFEAHDFTGIPTDEICSQARSNDLAIMGIRGEYERWSKHLLGDTVEAVSRQIAKPLLLVDRVFEPFNRIHCGYDGSDSAGKALQLSAHLAKNLKLLLQVICISNSKEEREEVLAEAGKYLEPYQLEYQLRHESGQALDALINAQNNAPFSTLLSIGSYGHSRIREAILGSTTIQLMRNATKPLLLAR